MDPIHLTLKTDHFPSKAKYAQQSKDLQPILELALGHLSAGRADAARLLLQRLVPQYPDFVMLHHLIAVACQGDDRQQAAYELGLCAALEPAGVEHLADFIAFMPSHVRLIHLDRLARLLTNQARPASILGTEFLLQGHAVTAAVWFYKAIALDPENALTANNLAQSLMDAALWSLGRQWSQRSLKLAPGFGQAASNLAMAGCYDHITTAQASRDIHACAAAAYGNAPVAPIFRPITHRKLRIGFLPAEAGLRPMGRFLNPLLRNLDRSRFKIFTYGPAADQDSVWNCVDQHSVIDGKSDEVLHAQIGRDQIDVLVDLAGHASNGRMSVFSRRAAPLQVSWLGYFATTGLANMDAVFMDQYWVPKGAEDWFCEPVHRLTQGRFCLEADPRAPDCAEPPCLSSHVITFGCFNKRAKLNDLVFDLWADILHGVPMSRLYLKAVTLADPLIRQDVATAFHRRGIGANRLLLDGPSGPLATLDLYRWVDIALDPFPFGGGLTTIDALWMGVPVVTKIGTSPLSRQSAGLLHQAGFDQWIAQDADQYKLIAQQLAKNPLGLKQMRQAQRAKIAASSLCDGAGFARSFGEMIMALYQSRLTQMD